MVFFWDPTTKPQEVALDVWGFDGNFEVTFSISAQFREFHGPGRRLFAPVAPYYSSDPALLLKAWIFIDVKIPQAFPGLPMKPLPWNILWGDGSHAFLLSTKNVVVEFLGGPQPWPNFVGSSKLMGVVS